MAMPGETGLTPVNRPAPAVQRTLRIALGSVVCLLCAWMGVQAAHPFLLASRMHAANDQLRARVAQYALSNQRSERRVKLLETDGGVRLEARKLGWVMPGEARLYIPPK